MDCQGTAFGDSGKLVMLEHPENWKAYYRGDEGQVQVARAYSFSDRIRYYWPNTEVSRSLAVLIANLEEHPAPPPLVSQYLSRQAEAVRASTIKNDPRAIIRHKIRESLSRYSDACGLMLHTVNSCSNAHSNPSEGH